MKFYTRLLAIVGFLMVIQCGHGGETNDIFESFLRPQKKEVFDAAVAKWNTLLKQNPRSFPAYSNRGMVYLRQGFIDQAISDFTDAIRIDPKRAIWYDNRAEAYYRKRQWEKAAKDFDKAVEIAPEECFVHLVRGRFYLQTDSEDKALADFNKALQIESTNVIFSVWLYNARGVVYRREGVLDKAIADFNSALAMDAVFAPALSNRGRARCEKGLYDRAVSDFNEVVRLQPGRAQGYNDLAWLSATCPDKSFRDGRKAVEWATKACELTEWKNPAYTDTLAAANAESGDFEKAVEYEKQALAMSVPEDKSRAQLDAHLKLYEAKQPYREQGSK